MAKENTNSLGPSPNTKTVHVGAERYKILTAAAIEVSYKCGRQFTPSQIMHYLVEHLTTEAVSKMISELKPSAPTS